MRLNTTSSYILLAVLSGKTTSSDISAATNIEPRSVQRGLVRLLSLGLVTKSGPNNNPSYKPMFPALLVHDIPEKVLLDVERPSTTFNFGLLEWFERNKSEVVDSLVNFDMPISEMSRKEIEYLTVELSWKSSALEGNTYTLLDTELLLKEGLRAKGKTDFETQMVLNHKDAIMFILDNPELFSGDIRFSTIEHLHKLIGYNLGIDAGLRKKIVKISASNYTPPSGPQVLRETMDRILRIISNQNNGAAKSLLAFALVPYLQAFEDGNKRTGRMLANAILISTMGKGFSLRKVDAKRLALAYLAFYEFGSIAPLAKILQAELES